MHLSIQARHRSTHYYVFLQAPKPANFFFLSRASIIVLLKKMRLSTKSRHLFCSLDCCLTGWCMLLCCSFWTSSSGFGWSWLAQKWSMRSLTNSSMWAFCPVPLLRGHSSLIFCKVRKEVLASQSSMSSNSGICKRTSSKCFLREIALARYEWTEPCWLLASPAWITSSKMRKRTLKWSSLVIAGPSACLRLRMMQGDGSSRNSDKAITNLSFGSFCLVLLSIAIIVHTLSILGTIKQKKTWWAFLLAFTICTSSLCCLLQIC